MKAKWKQVSYTIAVVVEARDLRASKVFGRVHGERDDGQRFWAQVDFPWQWPARWRKWHATWQDHGRQRLDSFLSPFCKCEAHGAEIRECSLHRVLKQRWQEHDWRRAMGVAEVYKPTALPMVGVVPETVQMHKDYPWIRQSQNRWHCFACGSSTEGGVANAAWRNPFITKHSHCAFTAEKDLPGLMPSGNELYHQLMAKTEDYYFGGQLSDEQWKAIQYVAKWMLLGDLDAAKLLAGDEQQKLGA